MKPIRHPDLRPRLGPLVWCVAVIATLAGCVPRTSKDRVLYERSSAGAYDAGIVVGPEGFQPGPLLTLLRTFWASKGAHLKLSRLRVSPSERDLQITGNVDLPDMPPGEIPRLLALTPGYLGGAVGQPDIAEVLCVGANATALVRRAGRVVSYQIAGELDARDLPVSGMSLAIVGFRVDAVAGAGADPRGAYPGSVRIFVRMGNLPAPEKAAAARRELQVRLGTRTFLVLRTDPFFFEYGGPRTDVFEVPPPEVSAAEYLAKPSIACWPPSGHDPVGGCQLRRPYALSGDKEQ